MPLYKKIVGQATQVYVWRIDESELQLQDLLGSKIFILPQNKQRRLEKLSVYCLLKEAGLSFPNGYNNAGRPIVNEDVNVSISHSYRYAAIAVSGIRSVGVDVEKIDRNFERVATKYLTTAEQSKNPTHDELALIWSVKEAIYKLPWDKAIEISKDIEVDVELNTFAKKYVDAEVSGAENKTMLRLYFELFDGYTLVWY